MYVLLLLNARIKNPHKYAQEKPKKKIQYSEETYGIPVLNCLDIDIFTESVPLCEILLSSTTTFNKMFQKGHFANKLSLAATNEIARSMRFVTCVYTQVSCEYLTSLEFHLFLSADSFNAHTELLNIFWNATLVPLKPISFFKHVVESFIVQFVKFTSRNFLCCKFYNCLSTLFISLLDTE